MCQGAGALDEVESRARKSKGVDCDSQLKNSIEGIIIKWAYQVDIMKIKNTLLFRLMRC